ncbi:MAG: hypothetical protein PHU61_01215 [Candidatus Absconditabacteria bacterium]|nr:hypothetical protein [Candidatus Absconditabacteria bacterium]MDD3868081.1 hypothetical protein [Candidatus Absconditabacteria bacterium]MDD4714328.1 hypothetical protein [Candidatus Absconditabacteria bacterium]
MPFNPDHMEHYERNTETHEGREFLIEKVIGDMLSNFSDQEGVSKILRKTIRDGDQLPLEQLNKLYELSLNDDSYKNLYDFYMDLHDGKGTAFEHLQELMAKDPEWKDKIV